MNSMHSRSARAARLQLCLHVLARGSHHDSGGGGRGGRRGRRDGRNGRAARPAVRAQRQAGQLGQARLAAGECRPQHRAQPRRRARQRHRVGRRAAARGGLALAGVRLRRLALRARRRDVDLVRCACELGARGLSATPAAHATASGQAAQCSREWGCAHRRSSRPWKRTSARGCVSARQSWSQCALRARGCGRSAPRP